MKKSAALFYISFVLLLLISLDKKASANFVLDSEGTLYFDGAGEVLGRFDKKPDKEKANLPASKVRLNNEGIESSILSTPKIGKIEKDGNRMKVTLQDSAGEDIVSLESSNQTDLIVEESSNKNTMKVKALKDSFAIIQNRTAVQTELPLSVDMETNDLLVTTDMGTVTMSVMPDQAVRHVLASNFLDQVGKKGGMKWAERVFMDLANESSASTMSYTAETIRLKQREMYMLSYGSEQPFGVTPLEMQHCKKYGWTTFTEPEFKNQGQCVAFVVSDGTEWENPEEVEGIDPADLEEEPFVDETIEATPTEPEVNTEPEEGEEVIALTTNEKGKLSYRIPGVKYKKVLGFYEVPLERTVVVSAETGQVLDIEQSFTTQVLDYLSF